MYQVRIHLQLQEHLQQAVSLAQQQHHNQRLALQLRQQPPVFLAVLNPVVFLELVRQHSLVQVRLRLVVVQLVVCSVVLVHLVSVALEQCLVVLVRKQLRAVQPRFQRLQPQQLLLS
jgi:hypothetical protein